MAKTVEIDNSINTITAGTVIRGNITSAGDFRMDGMLEGNIAINGKLVVGEHGKIVGDIVCQNEISTVIVILTTRCKIVLVFRIINTAKVLNIHQFACRRNYFGRNDNACFNRVMLIAYAPKIFAYGQTCVCKIAVIIRNFRARR